MWLFGTCPSVLPELLQVEISTWSFFCPACFGLMQEQGGFEDLAGREQRLWQGLKHTGVKFVTFVKQSSLPRAHIPVEDTEIHFTAETALRNLN